MATYFARTSSLLAILLVGPAAARAAGKEESPRSPEAVAKAYFNALKANKPDEAARLMHPEALKAFRGMLLGAAKAADEEGQAKELLRLFSGVDSLDALKKLDPPEFFAAFLKAVGKLRPEIVGILTKSEAQVLGHVKEGKDLAHVVCRLKAKVDEAKMTGVTVISLRRTEKGWGVLLSAQIEGLGAALKKRFPGKDK
jgi:hypothetical protein